MKTTTVILFWSSILQLGILAIAILITAFNIVCNTFGIESVFMKVLLSFPMCWFAYKMFFAFTNAFCALLRCLRYKTVQIERRLHATKLKQLEK